MPGATYPDCISIYGYQPDAGFPVAFMTLLKAIRPRTHTDDLQRALYDVLDHSGAWARHLELTAQGMDLMGNERPYDCDDLVDFFFEGACTLDEWERVHYRMATFEQIGELRRILDNTLTQPLFPDEKPNWEKLAWQLSRLTCGSLITVYCY